MFYDGKTAPCAKSERDRNSFSRNIKNQCVVLPASLLILLGSPATTPVRADELMAVDVTPLATAYRASKLIGASVMNDANDKIGAVDDLIISHGDRVLFTVVSVGGFLGLGKHLVVVPYSSLVIDDASHKIMLPGATKDALKKLPEFQYSP